MKPVFLALLSSGTIIMTLFPVGRSKVRPQSVSDNATAALQKAISIRDSSGVRTAIVRGADIESRNSQGYSPLDLALFRHDLGVIRLLLVAGANVNATVTRSIKGKQIGDSHLSVLVDTVMASPGGSSPRQTADIAKLLILSGEIPTDQDYKVIYRQGLVFPELMSVFWLLRSIDFTKLPLPDVKVRGISFRLDKDNR